MNAKIPGDAHCLGCGYALRGLPEPVCPECGRAFDPGDPSTYRQGPWRLYWRRWVGPPRLWHALLALTVLVVLLAGYSEPDHRTISPTIWPGGSYVCFEIPVSALGLVILSVDFALHAVATLLELKRAELDREKRRARSAVHWCVLPLCLLVLLSAGLTRWPLHARFRLSRPALEATAKAYLDGTRANDKPGRVGLYHFDHIHREDAGVGFMNSYFFWRVCGFFYSPTETPPKGTDILWSWRIAPNWYVFEWDF